MPVGGLYSLGSNRWCVCYLLLGKKTRTYRTEHPTAEEGRLFLLYIHYFSILNKSQRGTRETNHLAWNYLSYAFSIDNGIGKCKTLLLLKVSVIQIH